MTYSEEFMNSIGDKDIAIIGMSGRFPKSMNLEEFWRNLRDGIEGVTFFTDEELLQEGVDPDLLKDPNYIKAAPVLEDVDKFDAAFFGYTPREAEIMDPQQRVFLELAWAALEDAGYVPETYNGLIGVYASVGWNTYLLSNLITHKELFQGGTAFQVFTSNDKDYMPTRVSYKLNLKGPGMIIQTACSSSLVAAHLAVLSLLNYECDIALVGGSVVKVPQKAGYYYQEGSLASPDGHCRAFDANGQGTVFGSGAGVVVLKRMAEALEDGDHIYAVIKGSAINNDGSVKVSYTAPSVEGQAEVIAAAQAMAGVEAESISYIEAHGTGTSLGDPIEVTALTKVFRENTQKKSFCAIGSVKTNVGHLDAAAGVAGLIKTALSLYYRMIPPSLNFNTPNPKIDFDNSPFFVNSTLREWPKGQYPRRAGVSSFGVGGTNAHLILEEVPELLESSQSRQWKLLVLSARTETALDNATANLLSHFKANPGLNLADAAYTLKVGRTVFRHRRMLVCSDIEDAISVLEGEHPHRILSDEDNQEPGDRRVVFMFTGQGSQYVNMGADLYKSEPLFRQNIDNCSRILKPYLGVELKDIIYPGEDKHDEYAQLINQTYITQPALFAIEYAMARQLMEWGIRPKAMIGHSIGEYVAACISGVLSLEEALILVAKRGKLMQDLPGGTMLAVGISEDQVQDYLDSELSLAAVNAPSMCVLSGSAERILKAEEELQNKGVVCRRLHTSHAFHSFMMEPILETFMECFRNIRLKQPEIPYISNLTGTWITSEEVSNPEYWARHLRSTVRFAQGVGELLKEKGTVLVEVGPGRTLSTLVRQQMDKNMSQVVINTVRHVDDKDTDTAFLTSALGKLWLAGVQIDWTGFYKGESRQRISLPTYPFEGESYWIGPKKLSYEDGENSKDLNKKPNIRDWFYTPIWKQSKPLKPFRPGCLKDVRGSWLVFNDTKGLGNCIIDKLRCEGAEVISVVPGEGFNRLDTLTFSIDINSGEDYCSLVDTLAASGKLPARIIHLTGITGEEASAAGPELFERAQKSGFYSLLYLGRAFGRVDGIEAMEITIISDYLYNVSGQEVTYPEKAILLGINRVIPQEYNNIYCKCIDIMLPKMPAGREIESLAEKILMETETKGFDTNIAYRGRQRWVQTYEEIKLEEYNEPLRSIRENGVYVITGGLEGIGLALAEHIAKKIKAKIVLIDEKELPDKEDWLKWLALHPDSDAVSLTIRRIMEMEEAGSEVTVIKADISSPDEIRDKVKWILAEHRNINGVIHAAGVSGEKIFGLIQETDALKIQEHFRLKVFGLYALESALKDMELDFAVLASSLASVLGGLGYAAYAASNIFMDAYAIGDRENHQPWISINWDAWELKEENNGASDIRTNLAQFAMSPEEGGEVFDTVLAAGTCPQVIVSTADMEPRLNQWTKRTSDLQQNRGYDSSAGAKLHPRPKLQNPYTAPETELEKSIARIWSRAFGFEQVGIHDNFFDLGGDSLVAIQVVNQLKKELKREISAVSLFQSLTIRSMAQLLEQDVDRSREEIAAQFEEEKDKASRRKQFQQNRRLLKKEREVDSNE
jgi:acyl transferase domain-containing protein